MQDGMKRFIGVKIVKARNMTRLGYCEFAADYPGPAAMLDYDSENQYALGYMVQYEQVDPDSLPYIAWCPKVEFEAANRPTDGMSFGHAIEAAKKGCKVARKEWGDKSAFVAYMPSLHPYFAVYKNTKRIPGWHPYESDMLADDWYIVE